MTQARMLEAVQFDLMELQLIGEELSEMYEDGVRYPDFPKQGRREVMAALNALERARAALRRVTDTLLGVSQREEGAHNGG